MRPDTRASSSRHMGDWIPGARKEEESSEWGIVGLMHENPPRRCRGETENAGELGCGIRKRRKA